MLLLHLHYTCNDTSTVIRPAVHAITVIIDNNKNSNTVTFSLHHYTPSHVYIPHAIHYNIREHNYFLSNFIVKRQKNICTVHKRFKPCTCVTGILASRTVALVGLFFPTYNMLVDLDHVMHHSLTLSFPHHPSPTASTAHGGIT